MGIFSKLSGLALRTVAKNAAKHFGIKFADHGVEAVSSYLTQHFTDHSLHLTSALEGANRRAWKTLEIALAGDSFWDRCQRALARSEDKAFREQVHAFLANCPLPAISGDAAAFRGKCLAQLRDASNDGHLAGKTSAAELAREAGAFARFAEPQRLLDAEWEAVGQIAQQLRGDGFDSLAQFLELRPPDAPPLLAIAVRYFFRRAVEDDAKLQWIVSSATWENLAAAQEHGFAGLAQALETHGDQVEALLEEMHDVVIETRDAVVEIRDDMKELNASVNTLLDKLPRAVSAESAAGVQLNPEFPHLLELQRDGGFRPWELKNSYYSVGRGDAKIRLADPRVSEKHLTIVQLGPHWLAINYSKAKRMRVGGRELRQKTLTHGDVIRIGETSLVFLAPSQPTPAEPLSPFAGKLRRGGARASTLGSLEEEDAATLLSLTNSGKVVATSSAQPILLGSHPACSVVLSGKTVAAMHAVLDWQPDGLHLIDLNSGRGTRCGGHPIKDTLVQDGQEIVLGEHSLMVHVQGDPCAPAAAWMKRRRETPPAVAVTCFLGPHAGESAVLPFNRAVVLGSAADSDLSLPREPLLQPRHLEICVPAESPPKGGVLDSQISLRDLTGNGGILVKGDGKTAVIGYAVQFGRFDKRSQTALMFHLDICLDAW